MTAVTSESSSRRAEVPQGDLSGRYLSILTWWRVECSGVDRAGKPMIRDLVASPVVFCLVLPRMTGEGLEPSTNGLTYLIGFHRPPES